MDMLTVALWAILIIAAGCGGYLVGRSGRHQCVICRKPLPRVCADGRCGETSLGHQGYESAEDESAAVLRTSAPMNKVSSGHVTGTGVTSENDELQHPSWCHRRGCAERGWHQSEPIRCNADPAMEHIHFYVARPEDERPTDPVEMLIVRVVLTQDIVEGRTLGPVRFEIGFYDVPEDYDAVILTPVQARMVASALVTLLIVGGLR